MCVLRLSRISSISLNQKTLKTFIVYFHSSEFPCSLFSDSIICTAIKKKKKKKNTRKTRKEKKEAKLLRPVNSCIKSIVFAFLNRSVCVLYVRIGLKWEQLKLANKRKQHLFLLLRLCTVNLPLNPFS